MATTQIVDYNYEIGGHINLFLADGRQFSFRWPDLLHDAENLSEAEQRFMTEILLRLKFREISETPEFAAATTPEGQFQVVRSALIGTEIRVAV